MKSVGLFDNDYLQTAVEPVVEELVNALCKF